MPVYVRALYLQGVHYYYYSAGVLSFFTALLIPFIPLYSLIFMALSCVNTAGCWYISAKLQRKVRTLIIINSRGYMARHVAVALALLLLEMAALFLAPGYMMLFIDAFMSVNLFALFMMGMMYVLSHVRFARKQFATDDALMMKVARNMLLEFRRRKGVVSWVTDEELKGYRPFSMAEVDRVLTLLVGDKGRNMEAWATEFERVFLREHAEAERRAVQKARACGDRAALPGLEKRLSGYESRLGRLEKQAAEMKVRVL
jgi:hypothetical protein